MESEEPNLSLSSITGDRRCQAQGTSLGCTLPSITIPQLTTPECEQATQKSVCIGYRFVANNRMYLMNGGYSPLIDASKYSNAKQ